MIHHHLFGTSMLLVLAALMPACRGAARPLPGSPVPSATGTENIAPPDRAPLRLPLGNPRIEVRKGERKLLLFSGDRLLRTYRVGLGLSPVGDKVREGDRRTPEGDFYVFIKNPKSAFYLSLGLSYPNLEHAKRGLRDGLISRTQYDEIATAVRQKKRPPQRTSLGGDIFIHGNGAQTDWTWGCVALENEDIKELSGAVEVGTPVSIKP